MVNTFDAKRTTLVCLHGFTGTLATFAAVFPSQTPYNVLGIDLPGHGATAGLVAPERYTMKQVCHDLAELTESLNLPCFCLLGYSMGARTALGFALHYPQKVQHLLLESGSPVYRRRTSGSYLSRSSFGGTSLRGTACGFY